MLKNFNEIKRIPIVTLSNKTNRTVKDLKEEKINVITKNGRDDLVIMTIDYYIEIQQIMRTCATILKNKKE